jgi:hypothetical protein
MTYAGQRIAWMFCLTIGLLILSGGIVVTFLYSAAGCFAILFAAPWMLGASFGLRRIAKFQRMNFQWYETTYPANVNGPRVTCAYCQGSLVQVRNLLQGTYTRAHICGRCGETLYFSPEYSKRKLAP